MSDFKLIVRNDNGIVTFRMMNETSHFDFTLEESKKIREFIFDKDVPLNVTLQAHDFYWPIYMSQDDSCRVMKFERWHGPMSGEIEVSSIDARDCSVHLGDVSPMVESGDVTGWTHLFPDQ